MQSFDGGTVHSKEFLASLGAVVVEFSNLEGTLALWLGILLSPQLRYDIGAATLAQALPYRQKLDQFAALYKTRFPERAPYGELNKLVRAMGKIAEGRNRALHGVWSETDEADVGFYARWNPSKTGVAFDQSYQSSADIDAFAKKVSSLMWKFAEFASLNIGVSGLNNMDLTGKAQRPGRRSPDRP